MLQIIFKYIVFLLMFVFAWYLLPGYTMQRNECISKIPGKTTAEIIEICGRPL